MQLCSKNPYILPPAALAIWLAFWSLLLCPRCSLVLIWPLVIALLSRMVACYGFFWILILWLPFFGYTDSCSFHWHIYLVLHIWNYKSPRGSLKHNVRIP